MTEYSAPPAAPSISPTVDMSTLSEAWAIIKSQMKPYAVYSAIYMGAVLAFSLAMVVLMISSIMAVLTATQDPIAALISFYLNPFFLLLIAFSTMIPVIAQGGYCWMTFQVLRGEEPTIKEGFATIKQNLSSLLVLGLIVCGIQFVLSFVCSIVALFFQAAIFIAVPAIIDQKMKPVDAMKFSYEKVKDNYWNVFGVSFLSALISGLGALACYVGLVVSMPFAGICPTLVYWKIKNQSLVGPSGISPYPREASKAAQMAHLAPEPVAESPRPADYFPETLGSSETPPDSSSGLNDPPPSDSPAQ